LPISLLAQTEKGGPDKSGQRANLTIASNCSSTISAATINREKNADIAKQRLICHRSIRLPDGQAGDFAFHRTKKATLPN
jgi:hypothetical protein